MTLTSRRVYILPTAIGLLYAVMCFAMLLGSMNYNNNLAFVLTFLLTSLGLVAMHQCQRILVGLEISFAGVDSVHAGQPVPFRIAVYNRSRSWRYGLQIYSGDLQSPPENLGPGESRVFVLEVPTIKRGYMKLSRIGIRTSFPFDLFRAWAWLHMELNGVVYPAAADRAPPPPATRMSLGHRQHDARGEEDFAGLRNFSPGDPPRHVAWKAFARSGDLYSKEFSGADTSSQWLEFDAVPNPDTEGRLSILTRWIVDADRGNRDYGLRIGTTERAPAHGATHRHACLETLALYGLDVSTDSDSTKHG